MDCSEMYNIAYSLQYEEIDYDAALAKYRELISMFPDRPEAEWAKSEIENIGNMASIEKPSAIETKNAKYQTALGMGKTIATIGWIFIFITAIAVIIAFVSDKDAGMMFGVVILVVGIPFGLLIVVNGQLLQAAVSTENNTDKTAQLLEILLNSKKSE